jgi:hypothetical protein
MIQNAVDIARPSRMTRLWHSRKGRQKDTGFWEVLLLGRVERLGASPPQSRVRYGDGRVETRGKFSAHQFQRTSAPGHTTCPEKETGKEAAREKGCSSASRRPDTCPPTVLRAKAATFP